MGTGAGRAAIPHPFTRRPHPVPSQREEEGEGGPGWLRMGNGERGLSPSGWVGDPHLEERRSEAQMDTFPNPDPRAHDSSTGLSPYALDFSADQTPPGPRLKRNVFLQTVGGSVPECLMMAISKYGQSGPARGGR